MKIELRNFLMQNKIFKGVDLFKDEEDWLDVPWVAPKRYKNKLIAYLQDALEITIPSNFF